MGDLSVGAILQKSYASLWHYKLKFVKISWFWIVFSLSLAVLLWLGTGVVAYYLGQFTLLIFFILYSLFSILYSLFWLPIASVSVAWHRIILDRNPPKSWFYLGAGRQVWRYLGAMFVFYLAASAVFVLLAYILEISQLGTVTETVDRQTLTIEKLVFLVFSLFWFASGFYLILPAIAVGHTQTGFGDVFRLAKGNRLKLLAIQLLIQIIFIVAVVGGMMVGHAVGMPILYLYGLIVLFLFLSWLVYLSSLSYSYQVLTG